MVSIRFICFLFVLVLILQNSAADIHQATEKIAVTDGNRFGGRSSSAIGKIVDWKTILLRDIISDVPARREARNGKTGGRKMMKRRVLLKEMAKAKEMANDGASKISGATHSVGNCSHKGKRKMNIDCRSTHPHVGRFKMSSFVALNSDYHQPKSHPPSHN